MTSGKLTLIVLLGAVAAACADDDSNGATSDAGIDQQSGSGGTGASDSGADSGADAPGDSALDSFDAGNETVVRMETGVANGAPGGSLTPGGMADTHAQFAGGPFSEIVYPFTIVAEPVSGSSYFWAQQFFFEGTTQGGYTGIQSNGIKNGQIVGKMLIFSIWDALEATPGPGAGCEPFGGEGVGQSCRLVFDWKVGVKYRMVLREASTDWWSVSVVEPTNQETVLGSIRVPDAWGKLTPNTAGFAEYYGAVAACDTLPHAVALLHQPSADGMPPTQIDAGVYGTCAAQSSSTCTGPLCI